MKFFKEKLVIILTISLFAVATFFSIYKLYESPPTWMDEGIIIQTARSIYDIGYPAIPVAPDKYESAGIVTTSYPVTIPVAMSFKLFGTGLIPARMVMVVYLLLLFIVSYIILKKFVSPSRYLLSFALFITFAPLYGQGKNVLGEVPGMFFFILFLSIIYFLELNVNKSKSIWLNLLAGLSGGLFVITKPIFILFIPAIFLAFIVKRFWFRNSSFVYFGKLQLFQFTIAFFLPIIVWFFFQFTGDSIVSIFSLYANPYKVNVANVVFSNIRLLFSDFQPFYFLVLFIIWSTSFIFRLWKKENIYFAELISFFFSSLVFVAFFRTPGFYRYFFPAQVLAILYFIPSLELFISKIKIFSNNKKSVFITLAVIALVVLQSYVLVFTSWTAKSYDSTRSKKMQESFSLISSKNIFLYQVPEVATFLPISSFYQFFYYAPGRSLGSKSLMALLNGLPDIVIVNSDVYKENKEMFYRYSKVDIVERYSILTK